MLKNFLISLIVSFILIIGISNISLTVSAITCDPLNFDDVSNYLSIKNSSNTEIAAIDKNGMMKISGVIQSWSTGYGIPDFLIKDDVGSVVSWIDSATGDLYLSGSLNENTGTTPSSSGNFVIQDSTGTSKAWFTKIGSLYLKSCLYEGAGIEDPCTTVDSAGGVGQWTSVTSDGGGNIHIGYALFPLNDVKYAKSTDGGVTWTTSIVENIGFVGEYISIALTADAVHMTYYALADSTMRYAKSTDGGVTWNVKVIESGISTAFAGPGAGRQMRIDTNGVGPRAVHVVYYDFNTDTLRYAKSTDWGDNWNIKVVDSGSDKASIDVDVSGRVHISYDKGVPMYILYTNWGDTFVRNTAVDSVGAGATAISSRSTPKDDVYIAYGTSSGLKVAKSTDLGQTWTTTIVDNVGGSWVSIDNWGFHDEVYVAYYEDGNDDLKYARTDDGGTTWAITTLDSVGSVGYWNSIEFGTEISISYYDQTNTALKFCRLPKNP